MQWSIGDRVSGAGADWLTGWGGAGGSGADGGGSGCEAGLAEDGVWVPIAVDAVAHLFRWRLGWFDAERRVQ